MNIVIKNCKEITCRYSEISDINTYIAGEGIYLIHASDFEENKDNGNMKTFLVSYYKGIVNWGQFYEDAYIEEKEVKNTILPVKESSGVSEDLFLKALAVAQDPNMIKEI